MTLNNYTAVGICEGFIPDEDDQIGDAWQYLIDTGLAWLLQGRFGREANDRIDAGLNTSPTQRT
jgi:hypothetical protein